MSESKISSVNTTEYRKPTSFGRVKVDYNIVPDEVVRNVAGSSGVAGYSMFTDSIEPGERVRLLKYFLGIREN